MPRLAEANQENGPLSRKTHLSEYYTIIFSQNIDGTAVHVSFWFKQGRNLWNKELFSPCRFNKPIVDRESDKAFHQFHPEFFLKEPLTISIAIKRSSRTVNTKYKRKSLITADSLLSKSELHRPTIFQRFTPHAL